ncbi:hypothetical protein OsI_36422 [Oryza sativa Indica Group]|uniref:Uncharacterized protein n=1 Tax=Oryza sativa subsp. indica TaxID=39946 RepID=B8BKZ0_ORYSI|nr:hypothetical protein OsI_36422 [Oryza sativa Indica Group]
MAMAVKANTTGVISFSLVLKPSRGDFVVRMWFDSAGGGDDSAMTTCDRHRSAIPTLEAATSRGGSRNKNLGGSITQFLQPLAI